MAKAIMVQGTMSNAGKSLLAAGLCRIFKQDGYRVAPFKSQNMALNSFITEEGLEMGRAQVMQAEAAGIKPSVLMNPILLKPTNDVGSQVIVNGEVLGTMSARDYFKYKKKLVPDIMKAYDKLVSENDIIVIEGAGSPAEINLKTEDIVNMGMAKMAKAPVLLVGDIDRGGVFAQLIGTVELLEEDEREMVKGLIINKFRGDKTILDPGVQMLEERSHIPVVGVAPYLDIQVEDEDSLTERFDRKQEVDLIDIAVIRVPRISNFTDFNPLESIPGVSLRYVQHVSELKNPDMIILPGTKNTMEDLLWMRANGLEAAVLKEAAKGKIIFGICGGYQMLGETLSDPHHVEAGGTIKGMGLLPMDTVFAEKKTRTRVSGRFLELEGELQALSGAELEGYEIHMGETVLKGEAGHSVSIEDQVSGECKEDGAYRKNVCGTYVHGVFDRENDIIVIEGAGSPAEINLKTEDIVNMGMAKMAKAPVLLVGDIDRGGVFAQLIGTVELLEEDEREMVKGLIINKFRGDKTILDPGVQMLEERSHIPVVGVAPYLDIQVEDEDSLTERFDRKQEVDLIDIAVIRVPRISNFTDFNPLESIPGVSLRYVQHVSELKNPDMIILPGTKNTMEDLLWMRANGLEAAVLKEAAKGKIIFGICGGYQMLGETLSDPHHVEAGGTIKGMGLLPMDTVFAEKKTRTRVSGRFLELEGELQALSGAELEGYEIHMGETVLKGEAGHSVSIEDQVSGECKEDGAYRKNVCGTYVHGVFDREDVAEAVIRVLGEKKGIDVSQMTGIDFAAFKETQYDILAAELRKHLDMKKIYDILEQGI